MTGEFAQSTPSKDNGEPVMTATALHLGFGAREVLSVPSLRVSASEIVSIVGASGSGKTTLLSCLSGQLEPLGGTYVLGGAERGRGVRSTYASRTLQSFPLFHWLTVAGNLEVAAKVRRVSRPDVDNVLANFSASALRDRFPSSLSGGERCRASLSHALLGNPKLLLLDEPFTGLDTIVKQSVANTLFRWARSNDAAALFVTHDIHDAIEFSDRVVVIGSTNPATIVAEVPSRSPGAIDAVRSSLVSHQ